MDCDTETGLDLESKVKSLSEKIADKLPCPEGDIFSLPTVADLTNMFNEIAQLPGKLKAKLLEMKAEQENEIAELVKQLKNPDLTDEEIAAIQKQIEEKENYIEHTILGEIKEQIEEIIEQITKFVDTLSEILSPYWKTDGVTRNWQKEARDAFAELLQEFHTYIPAKIAELVGKLVPAMPTINIFGLEIDIIKLVTSPNYRKELKAQIGGKQFVTQIREIKKQLAELQKKQTNPDLTDEERDELQKQIDKLREGVIDLEKLREEWVGKFFKLIPEEFRQFDGEFGVVDPDAQAEIVWKYIKTEIKEWMQNWYLKAWEKLISIFKEIWDLLGLPFLPIDELLAIMEMDIGALIEARIKSIKEKWKNTKVAKKRQIKKLVKEIEKLEAETPINAEEMDKKHAEKKKLEEELLKEMEEFHKNVKEKLLGINIFGFDILALIGGVIDSTAKSLEEDIAEICMTLKDFKSNWHKKIMFEWVKIVKKFISAIGLGAIFEFMFLTWCDFLKLIGMKMEVGLGSLSIAGVISTVQSKTKSDSRPTQDRGSDEGVSYAAADGERTAYSVSSGTGTVHAFVNGVEYEDGSGVSISGNTVTFDTPPAAGLGVSIIKI